MKEKKYCVRKKILGGLKHTLDQDPGSVSACLNNKRRYENNETWIRK